MILMLIGVAGAAAGGATIAAGMMHPDVPLSPTWITSGTIAVVGGLILIGLGAVVSRLRRIVDLLDRRPVMPLSVADAKIEPITAARPTTPKPTGTLAAVPPSDVKPPDAETPALTSAQAPAVTVEPPAPPSADGEPSLLDKTRDLFEKPVDQLPPTGAAPEVTAVPPPKTDGLSTRDWPRPPSNDRFSEPRGDAPPNVPPIMPPPERPMPRVDMPPPAAPARPAEPELSPAPGRSSPTVLKSGVIEGMAYTLYSDGSIEAELAQGSMRFDSIPALRAYLRDIG
jgi:hypothetical protein